MGPHRSCKGWDHRGAVSAQAGDSCMWALGSMHDDDMGMLLDDDEHGMWSDQTWRTVLQCGYAVVWVWCGCGVGVVWVWPPPPGSRSLHWPGRPAMAHVACQCTIRCIHMVHSHDILAAVPRHQPAHRRGTPAGSTAHVQGMYRACTGHTCREHCAEASSMGAPMCPACPHMPHTAPYCATLRQTQGWGT